MKPHKHAELIKAWADGAEIQSELDGEWLDTPTPSWSICAEYRIKPEPKPDRKTVLVNTGLGWHEYVRLDDAGTWIEGFAVIRDGETGKLKSAEVLK